MTCVIKTKPFPPLWHKSLIFSMELGLVGKWEINRKFNFQVGKGCFTVGLLSVQFIWLILYLCLLVTMFSLRANTCVWGHFSGQRQDSYWQWISIWFSLTAKNSIYSFNTGTELNEPGWERSLFIIFYSSFVFSKWTLFTQDGQILSSPFCPKYDICIRSRQFLCFFL